MMTTSIELIRKYNVAGPRYTSYPTVPFWEEESIDEENWKQEAKKTFDATNQSTGISLYIHLPFCEKLCTFCGCNKRITINHDVESPYITTLLKEWDMYLAILEDKPIVREIHLGGGTPTFFSPENLSYLLNSIYSKIEKHPDFELSFEAHPNVTTREHLEALYKLGSRRVSYGIQDFDEKVQIAIHRQQTFEQIQKVTTWSKEIGYDSVNYDLVYGLPFQTLDSVKRTIKIVNTLQPDRIAFYSYAHVPWVAKAQRGYDENDLPKGSEKRDMYEQGRLLLESCGYHEIGMDHFSLESDSLYKAYVEGKLHRNFMGYSHNYTELMIGLGVSSISDSWGAFAQNNKSFEEYVKCIDLNQLPIIRGHKLTEEDLWVRQHILNIMCHFKTVFDDNLFPEILVDARLQLAEMEKDALITWEENTLNVTQMGKAFVRNICMTLDARLQRNQPETRIFSSVI